VVRLDSGGYFALQSLDMASFAEMPPIFPRIGGENLKLF